MPDDTLIEHLQRRCEVLRLQFEHERERADYCSRLAAATEKRLELWHKNYLALSDFGRRTQDRILAIREGGKFVGDTGAVLQAILIDYSKTLAAAPNTVKDLELEQQKNGESLNEEGHCPLCNRKFATLAEARG